MKRLDKKYMLFLFGDFSSSDDLPKEIANQLSSIFTSKYMKFNYGEFGMVLHFRSEENFEDLKEYINICLNQIINQYFFIEIGENIDIHMDKKLKKDFLNIDGETKNGSITIENKIIVPTQKEIDNVFQIMFPILEPKIFKNEEKIELTVDQILEKITKEGIKSLTKKEIEILDNYGNKSNGQ